MLTSFFHAEEGFLRTFADLTLRPGSMIKDYIDGKRARYTPAFKYTVFTLFVATVAISQIEQHFGWNEKVYEGVKLLEEEHLEGPGHTPVVDLGLIATFARLEDGKAYKISSRGREKVIKKERLFEFARLLIPLVQSSFERYAHATMLFWIPLMGLLSFLIFRSWHWNLAEHLTAQAYLFAHGLLLFCLLSVGYWIAPNHAFNVFLCSIAAPTAYYLISYAQLANASPLRTVSTICFSFGVAFVMFSGVTVGLLTLVVTSSLGAALSLPF